VKLATTLFAFAALLAIAPAAHAARPNRLGVPAPPGPMRSIAIAEDQRRWSDRELRGYLDDNSAPVRARATLAVGRLQDTTSVDVLIGMLDDPSTEVRREAAFALGQVGRPEARASLVAELTDMDAEVVRLTVEALGKLGDKRATEAVAAFLDSRLPRLRSEAAMALWRVADTSAAGVLLTHLADPEADVRWRVVWALEKLPLPARIVPAVAPLLADPDPLVRAHAARTLGREKSRLATAALLAGLGDADVAVRVNVLRSLQQVADSSSAAVLPALTSALGATDPYVRVTAATALAEPFAWLAAPRPAADAARAALARGLADPDAATRGAYGRALVMRFGSAGWTGAAPLLGDASPYAQAALLDGLRGALLHPPAGQAAPGTATATLLAALRRDRALIVRMTAAEVAGQAPHRPAAAWAALRDTLRAGVMDANVLYASACAGALGDWGDSASVKRLAKAYAARGKDADPDARQAIRDALRQLAGRAYADSLERAHPAPAAPAVYPEGFELAPRERRAVIHTAVGDIEWELLGRDAPQTVRNFVTLARKGWFDRACYHRVVPDFVIQDGDPTGTGSGGPGYTIRCEYNRLQYDTGMVGMALSGKDTGGSQWFITLSPQPHLNGRYTIFARVTKGLDVAKRVTQGTVIERVEILP
jgi:cyclophilin family peptidyl-prolyl cis-trans isomerase